MTKITTMRSFYYRNRFGRVLPFLFIAIIWVCHSGRSLVKVSGHSTHRYMSHSKLEWIILLWVENRRSKIAEVVASDKSKTSIGSVTVVDSLANCYF